MKKILSLILIFAIFLSNVTFANELTYDCAPCSSTLENSELQKVQNNESMRRVMTSAFRDKNFNGITNDEKLNISFNEAEVFQMENVSVLTVPYKMRNLLEEHFFYGKLFFFQDTDGNSVTATYCIDGYNLVATYKYNDEEYVQSIELTGDIINEMINSIDSGDCDWSCEFLVIAMGCGAFCIMFYGGSSLCFTLCQGATMIFCRGLCNGSSTLPPLPPCGWGDMPDCDTPA